MNTSGESELDDWIDLASTVLHEKLNDPRRWEDTSNEDCLAFLDFAQRLANEKSEGMKLLLYAAHKIATKVYVDRVEGGKGILFVDEAHPARQLVSTVALRAAQETLEVLQTRFGPKMPTVGWRKVHATRSERLVAAALQAQPATVKEAAKKAGMSRATFYRRMSRKATK